MACNNTFLAGVLLFCLSLLFAAQNILSFNGNCGAGSTYCYQLKDSQFTGDQLKGISGAKINEMAQNMRRRRTVSTSAAPPAFLSVAEETTTTGQGYYSSYSHRRRRSEHYSSPSGAFSQKDNPFVEKAELWHSCARPYSLSFLATGPIEQDGYGGGDDDLARACEAIGCGPGSCLVEKQECDSKHGTQKEGSSIDVTCAPRPIISDMNPGVFFVSLFTIAVGVGLMINGWRSPQYVVDSGAKEFPVPPQSVGLPNEASQQNDSSQL